MTESFKHSPPAIQGNLKSNSGVRRARLRDFQTQLMERMQAAKAGTQGRANQLGVMIGQSRYLVDLREAGEIVSSGNMTKVPLTKDWYLGVANIRGTLTSVIDFSKFKGDGATPQEVSNRVLAFSSSLAFNSGLLVTQVLGLRNSEEMQLLEEKVNQDSQGVLKQPWLLNQFLDKDGNQWSQLSLSLLVIDQDFLQIAQ